MKMSWRGKITVFILALLLSMITSPSYASAFEFDGTTVTDDYGSGCYNIIHSEQKDERINDYAINENNEIAVATAKYINIYDENGVFLYGYSLSISGAYAIDFYIDGIDIYRVRQQDLIRLDKEGHIVSVLSVESTPENDKIISDIHKNMRQTSKEYNGYQYKMNSSLTKLERIGSDGTKLIIYASSESSILFDCLFVISVVAIVTVILIKRTRKTAN